MSEHLFKHYDEWVESGGVDPKNCDKKFDALIHTQFFDHYVPAYKLPKIKGFSYSQLDRTIHIGKNVSKYSFIRIF